MFHHCATAVAEWERLPVQNARTNYKVLAHAAPGRVSQWQAGMGCHPAIFPGARRGVPAGPTREAKGSLGA